MLSVDVIPGCFLTQSILRSPPPPVKAILGAKAGRALPLARFGALAAVPAGAASVHPSPSAMFLANPGGLDSRRPSRGRRSYGHRHLGTDSKTDLRLRY
jgi:hypothetical protein